MRRQLILVLTVCSAGAIAFAGCSKKPKGDKGGSDPSAGMTEGGKTAGKQGDMTAAKAAKGFPSPKAACADGARPGQPLAKEGFRLEVKAPAQGGLNADLKAEVVVTPKDGYKYNLKFPTELSLAQTPGIKLARSKFENAHVAERTEKGLRLQVSYKANAAGKKVLSGKFAFSVCTKEQCLTPEPCIAWATDVK